MAKAGPRGAYSEGVGRMGQRLRLDLLFHVLVITCQSRR